MQVPFGGWALLALGFLLGISAIKAKGDGRQRVQGFTTPIQTSGVAAKLKARSVASTIIIATSVASPCLAKTYSWRMTGPVGIQVGTDCAPIELREAMLSGSQFEAFLTFDAPQIPTSVNDVGNYVITDYENPSNGALVFITDVGSFYTSLANIQIFQSDPPGTATNFNGYGDGVITSPDLIKSGMKVQSMDFSFTDAAGGSGLPDNNLPTEINSSIFLEDQINLRLGYLNIVAYGPGGPGCVEINNRFRMQSAVVSIEPFAMNEPSGKYGSTDLDQDGITDGKEIALGLSPSVSDDDEAIFTALFRIVELARRKVSVVPPLLYPVFLVLVAYIAIGRKEGR